MAKRRLTWCAALWGFALAAGAGAQTPAAPAQPPRTPGAAPTAPSPTPGGPATVSIEFSADRGCEVSAAGDGFRSHAVYKPRPAQNAGELRCAIPPVPHDRTIALTVKLPPKGDKPNSSEPVLQWNQSDDRWVGTAQLTEWPDAVTISTASRLRTFGAVAASLLVVFLALIIRRRLRRRLEAARSRAR